MKIEKEYRREASPRFQFKSWYEYFFSVNNLCIGLSNFLIFPAKVHEYRGGAFIIAYFLMIIAIGYPVLYLELIIGQFHRCSPVIFIRRAAPILQGFGFLAVLSGVLILYPYQYSVARAFKFIVSLVVSRSQNMPWSTCDNLWNTDDCYEFYNEKCPDLKIGHIMFQRKCVNESKLIGGVIESAEEQYLYQHVHRIGPTHMSLSTFDNGMACSIFIVWLIIAFIQIRIGTKVTAMVYVPTVGIFLICPFLLFRALHLDGATNGVREMFRVEWAELLYSKIWMDALNLVIQSLSIGIGGHSIMASFASKEKYTFQIATLAVIIDTSLSLIITGTVYSILGFISFSIGRGSVYDVTIHPPRILLTHCTVPVLLRKVAQNAWLWVFLYYVSLLVVGWKSCALVLKTIAVTLADIYNFSSNNFLFDILLMVLSILTACFGLLLCSEGGPAYIPMIEDIQKVTTGLFITAQLLIIIEIYGLNNIYGDIHELMGSPSVRQWSHAYSWSIWKWRWRMAPALSFIYVLSAFFREYPSPQNDLVFNNYYDYMQIGIIILIVIQPLIFAYYSYFKMFHHMEEHEETKTFRFKTLWHPQRCLRSWNRIRNGMSEEEKEFADNHLPEKEPEDPNQFWNKVYSSLSKETVIRPRSVVKALEKTKRKQHKTIDELPLKEQALTFEAIEGFNNCLVIFVPHGPLFNYPVLSQNLISIRCGMCAYTFALLAVHFLYRYLAVCKPLAISQFFKPKRVILNALFVMCYGSSWMLIGHIIMWPDEHIHSLIDSKFIEVYNTSSRDLAMIVANYEYPVYSWTKSGILGMFIATVVTTCIMISYVFFAIRIHQSLKACTLSNAVKRLHSSLLKSLIAQTIIPLISTIIPCFVIWFLPIAGDSYGVFLSTYFMPLLSIYPAIDPMVVTCSLSDYRNAFMTSIGLKRRQEENATDSKPPLDNLFTLIPSIT